MGGLTGKRSSPSYADLKLGNPQVTEQRAGLKRACLMGWWRYLVLKTLAESSSNSFSHPKKSLHN